MLVKTIAAATLGAGLLAGCGMSSAANTPAPRTSASSAAAVNRSTHPQLDLQVASVVHTATSGSILFGRGLKGKHLVHKTSKINLGKGMAWIAHFSQAAGRSKLSVKLVQISGPGTFPETAWSASVTVSKSSKQVMGQRSAKQLKPLHRAKFELEYLAGHTVLASGTVKLLNCAACSGSGGGY